jgi:hypothetical protein
MSEEKKEEEAAPAIKPDQTRPDQEDGKKNKSRVYKTRYKSARPTNQPNQETELNQSMIKTKQKRRQLHPSHPSISRIP